ncbi:putative transposase/invertase (TIGR01784 family) [Clostridium punense]|uniref:Transposase/invertase (TIGR01784 family) n=1 Tax=Clostridium punense TaxID=1054297 RepID=A0ABS4K127_9CLOT|nr:Rpn family recombination-promoting nuclease/putative transposase [Clostridium punense]MBP2021487.1 putative transposase/invertase (TIGR01784 family) [Clostridium punense]
MHYNSVIENYFVRENSDKYEEFLLKPKNDFVFKKIFGDAKNKDLLIALLNSILSDKVNDVTILNSELLKENIEDKKSVLDVRAVTDIGHHIDIEIQVLRTVSMPERSLYYWSKLYIEQIAVGESYKKLKKTIAINIVDYDYINTSKYHNIFHIMEDETKLKLTEVLEIHFIELSKLRNVNNMDKLSQWMNFIKGDSKEVILEMAKVNSDIEKAYDILRTMSQDREARALYLSREMALHDEVTRREEALEEGRVTLLLEQLNRKFKGLSDDLAEKIRKLPEEKFKTLALEIFELNSIEDIYKYL